LLQAIDAPGGRPRLADGGPTQLGRLSVAEETSHGFSVLFWRDGGLGYALVSDISKGDLEVLASRINPE